MPEKLRRGGLTVDMLRRARRALNEAQQGYIEIEPSPDLSPEEVEAILERMREIEESDP